MKSSIIVLLLCISVSFLMHLPHLNKDLISIHAWRQTQTQSTTISFYEEDMNILNPKRNHRGSSNGIFRMEFPLMQWLNAVLFKVFGNHIWITRVYMFVIGVFSIVGLYFLTLGIFNNKIQAWIAAWTFTFSPAFYYYMINPFPDNLALSCSIWGCVFFVLWTQSSNKIHLLISGIFLSIGTLCKLPFVLFYAIPFGFFIQFFFEEKAKTIKNASFLFSFILIPITWYAYVIPKWPNNPVVKGILNNNNSSKILEYVWHNLISTLPELLLNYGSVAFFIFGVYFVISKLKSGNIWIIPFSLFLIAFLLYYFFESNAIGNAHDYYLFPIYPILFLIVSFGAIQIFKSSIKWAKTIVILVLLILPITCYLRMKTRWNEDTPGISKDLFEHKIELRNAVPKDALVVAGNDNSLFIMFYYIDKKGWGFYDDKITPTKLQQYISEGAEFIYSNTPLIENDSFSHLIDEMILQKGSIKIYKLKK